MNRCPSTIRAIALCSVLGCAPSGEEPTQPGTPAPVPSLASLDVSASVPWVIRGHSVWIQAVALLADSARAPTSTHYTWSVSSESIASIASGCVVNRCDGVYLTAKANGPVTVSVGAGGRTASVTVTSVVDAPLTTDVAVDSFSVEELPVPDGEAWFYVPSMRLRNTTGSLNVDVIGMTLTFPDKSSSLMPMVLCSPTYGVPIEPGSTRNVFDPGSSGRLEFSSSFGSPWDYGLMRSDPGVVQATVYVRTGSGSAGSIGTVRASGPLEPASASTVSTHKPVYQSSKWMTSCA